MILAYRHTPLVSSCWYLELPIPMVTVAPMEKMSDFEMRGHRGLSEADECNSITVF